MDVPFNHRMEEYYQRFIDLQEKLRKSEEERLKLEMKFNELLQRSREEEQAYYRKIRSQYKRFLDEDRKRQERNEKILRALERIESRVNSLMSKTERFKVLRRQYKSYLSGVSSKSKINNHNTDLDFPDQEVSGEIPSIQKNGLKNHDEEEEKMAILDRYLRNFRSNDFESKYQKSMQAPPKDNKMKTLDDLSKRLSQTFDSNKANSIAEDIMNSIYNRHYKKDAGVCETQKKITTQFGAPKVSDCDSDNEKIGLDFREKLKIYPQEHRYSQDNKKVHEQSVFNQVPNYDNHNDKNDKNINTEKDFIEPMKTSHQNPREYITLQEKHNSTINNNGLHKTVNFDDEKLRKISDKFSISVNPEIVGELSVKKSQKVRTNSETQQEIQMDNVEAIEGNNQVDNRLIATAQCAEKSEEKYNDIRLDNQNNTNLENYTNAVQQEKQLTVSITPLEENVNNKSLSEQTSDNSNQQLSKQQTQVKSEPHSNESPTKLQQNNETSISVLQHEKIGNHAPEEYSENDETIHQQQNNGNYQQHSEKIGPIFQPIQDQQFERGQLINQQYDENIQPIYQQYNENGQPILPHVYDENSQHNIHAQYDENGQSINIEYDEHGKPITKNVNENVEPIHYQQDVTNIHLLNQHYKENAEAIPYQDYDQNNQPVAQHYDENNQLLHSQYDENGQPILQQYDDLVQSGTQRYEEKDEQILHQQYDENGQLSHHQQYDENGQSLLHQQYDESGRPIPHQQYDENGQPILHQQYDENGQPILHQQYDENCQPILHQQYDENGQPILHQQYDESGLPLYQQYDENGQPIHQEYEEHGQAIVNQQYDENGQAILHEHQQYDENGQPYVQQYDQYGQPIIHYDENGQPRSQQYDEHGQPILQQQYDENGQPIYQQYDETAYPQTYDENSYNQTQQEQYDAQGTLQEDLGENLVSDSKTDNISNIEADKTENDHSVIEEKKEETLSVKVKKSNNNVLDLLDTDTESARQNTSKISHDDSDFDFSNG